MMQLSIFDKLPEPILQKEWYKEHIKNPPPVNITDEQRKQAQEKLNQYSSLRGKRSDRSNLINYDN